MPFINVRGVDRYYEWICQHESGIANSDSKTLSEESPSPNITDRQTVGSDKPVMVFIHGWGGSSRYWRTIAGALAVDYDCLLYDLRGFGRSVLPQPLPNITYEMSDYAEDLMILLDTLKIDRVCVHAHSMGASIATFFINRYSDRADKAILTCNGIFEYDAKAFAAFHKFGSYVVKFRYKWFLKVPLADRMFMARFLTRPIAKSERIAFLEDFLLADYEAAVGTIYTSVSKQAVETMPKEFAKISIPTLMISGEKDLIIPAKMGKQASQLNPKLEYREIPSTGHFPMLEAKSVYLETIREFLSSSTQLASA